MNIKYRPDIDGLRAISIFAVIFFHYDFSWAKGGFVGVDVFFVISGYLITTLILNSLKKADFSFKAFYIRRAKRLLPAAIVMTTLVVTTASIGMSPDLLQRCVASALAAFLSISNVFFYFERGYFDAASSTKPLLHTWSLGVEEQFYFIWPTLLLLISRLGSRIRILAATSFVTLIAVIISELAVRYKPDAAYFLAPFRTHELLLGAILAQVSSRPQPRLSSLLALSGLLMIVGSVLLYSESTPFPGVYALLPCMGAALIIWAGPDNSVSRLLSLRFPVFIGIISYSLYLYHWPIIVFYKYFFYRFDLTELEKWALVCSAIVTAWLSYKFIELPFRSTPVSGRKPLVILASLCASTAIASIIIYESDGWLSRVPNRAALEGGEYGGAGYGWRESYAVNGNAPSYILYGDSHAKQYIGALRQLASTNGAGVELVTRPDCLSLAFIYSANQTHPDGGCASFYNELLKSAHGNSSPIFLTFLWNKPIFDHRLANSESISPEDRADYQKLVLSALDQLIRDVGPEHHVFIIGNVPGTGQKQGYRFCIDRPFPVSTRLCPQSISLQSGKMEWLRKSFLDFSTGTNNVTFIDPYDRLCSEARCYSVIDQKLLYSDAMHLSENGASRVLRGYIDGGSADHSGSSGELASAPFSTSPKR